MRKQFLPILFGLAASTQCLPPALACGGYQHVKTFTADDLATRRVNQVISQWTTFTAGLQRAPWSIAAHHRTPARSGEWRHVGSDGKVRLLSNRGEVVATFASAEAAPPTPAREVASESGSRLGVHTILAMYRNVMRREFAIAAQDGESLHEVPSRSETSSQVELRFFVTYGNQRIWYSSYGSLRSDQPPTLSPPLVIDNK